MDALVLNTRSALEVWQRSLGKGAHAMREPGQVACAVDARSLNRLAASLPPIARPVVVASGDRTRRCQSRDWVSRVWSKGFPEESVLQLGGTGVYACAPWFCYLQMAAGLNLPDAIRLGMELCGSHSTLPFAPGAIRPYRLTEAEERDGFARTFPITSADDLRRSLQSAPFARYSKALRAARFVVDGSRSPGQSRLYILLCLPVRLGGYGLPRPLLNARVDVPAHLRELAGCARLLCDFYYPAHRLAIEYDGGYLWQGGRRMDGSTQRDILDDLDIRTIRIDARQVAASKMLDLQAHRIAASLGVRMRRPSPANLEKRRLLRRQALDCSSSVYR